MISVHSTLWCFLHEPWHVPTWGVPQKYKHLHVHGCVSGWAEEGKPTISPPCSWSRVIWLTPIYFCCCGLAWTEAEKGFSSDWNGKQEQETVKKRKSSAAQGGCLSKSHRTSVASECEFTIDTACQKKQHCAHTGTVLQASLPKYKPTATYKTNNLKLPLPHQTMHCKNAILLRRYTFFF